MDGVGQYRRSFAKGMAPMHGEATALLLSASHLKRAQRRGTKVQERNTALLDNLEIWDLFAHEVAQKHHPLPAQARANIISLAIFVQKRTRQLFAEPTLDARKLDVLVQINLNLAQGLEVIARALQEQLRRRRAG